MRLRHGSMPGMRTGQRQSVMKVSSVNIGQAQSVQIGGRVVTSAIIKHAIAGPVAANALGLEGDEQADLAVHGGLAKAV